MQLLLGQRRADVRRAARAGRESHPFREDENQIGEGFATENLALLRRFALNCRKQRRDVEGSRQRKAKRCFPDFDSLIDALLRGLPRCFPAAALRATLDVLPLQRLRAQKAPSSPKPDGWTTGDKRNDADTELGRWFAL